MPTTIRRVTRAAARRLRAIPPAAARRRLRRQIAAAPPPAFDAPRVFYGVSQMDESAPTTAGGFVKFQRLAAVFPNSPADFNTLYLGSSSFPPDISQLLRLARKRGA